MLALCWLCPDVSPAQAVQITASGGLQSGQTNCIVVTTLSPGPISVVVELNGIILKTTINQTSDTQAEVCFDLPPNSSGSDVTVTATSGGGDSGSNIWVIP